MPQDLRRRRSKEISLLICLLRNRRCETGHVLVALLLVQLLFYWSSYTSTGPVTLLLVQLHFYCSSYLVQFKKVFFVSVKYQIWWKNMIFKIMFAIKCGFWCLPKLMGWWKSSDYTHTYTHTLGCISWLIVLFPTLGVVFALCIFSNKSTKSSD